MSAAAKAVFLEVMQCLRLDGPYKQEFYVDQMLSRFGEQGERFMAAVDAVAARGETGERLRVLYERMAANPELARFVVAHSWSELYRASGVELLASGLLAERTVIDFGCGPGLLTLCLAHAVPSARFVGIDRDAIVPAAQRLQQANDPGNVRFVGESDAKDVVATDAVVLLHAVTHELWPKELEAFAPPSAAENQHANTLGQLASWVGHEGLVVTLNRFPYFAQQLPRLDAIFARVKLRPCATRLGEKVVVQGHKGTQVESLQVRVYRRAV